MCRSCGDTNVPFKLASITRRQTSTVAWSPRSFAASRTIHAASSGFSCLVSSEPLPGRLRAPNEIAFIWLPLDRFSHRISPGRRLNVAVGDARIFARLIEFQNLMGRLHIEAAIFLFQLLQLLCRNTMIFGT